MPWPWLQLSSSRLAFDFEFRSSSEHLASLLQRPLLQVLWLWTAPVLTEPSPYYLCCHLHGLGTMRMHLVYPWSFLGDGAGRSQTWKGIGTIMLVSDWASMQSGNIPDTYDLSKSLRGVLHLPKNASIPLLLRWLPASPCHRCHSFVLLHSRTWSKRPLGAICHPPLRASTRLLWLQSPRSLLPLRMVCPCLGIPVSELMWSGIRAP